MKLLEYLKKPSKFFIVLDNFGIIRLSDITKIKLEYKFRFNKKINLKEPKTFNEKLQWLKLYYRKNEFSTMVDKYDVKDYVGGIIGKEYLIPTLGIYEKFEDIDFEKLPNQFVIKCTHDSGSIVICKDKEKFDKKNVRKIINKFMKRKYFYIHREWPYKNLKPRILIEPFLKDKNNNIGVLDDYKIMCFNGTPKLIELHRNRGNLNHTQDFYDINWNKTNIKQPEEKMSNIDFKKPETFDLMIKFSEKLSKNLPHIRVDWYEVNGKLYFGELTFYDGAGLYPFEPESYDELLGSWIDLPKSTK